MTTMETIQYVKVEFNKEVESLKKTLTEIKLEMKTLGVKIILRVKLAND